MNKKPVDNRRYNLTWKGQVIVREMPYALCNGKKTELSNNGWSKHLFKIVRAK